MKRVAVVLALVSAVGLTQAAFGWEVPPHLINYQGRLLNGTNLVNGNVELELRLFKALAGGSPLYVDSNTVTVVDGLYSTFIGDNTVSGSLVEALTNTEVWVEVAVNGVALSPRERLSSVAYSLATRGIRVDDYGNVYIENNMGVSDSLIFWPGQYGFVKARVGMRADDHVGFYGYPGAVWGLVMNITNGNVGICDTSPQYTLSVNGLAHRQDNSANWTVASDRRIKTGIQPISDALALLERIKPVNFFYIHDHRTANPGLPAAQQFGIVAQDYQQVFPDFVHTNSDGYLTVDTSPLNFVNTAAIKDMAKENAELKAEIDALKARLDALEKRQ